MTSNPLPGVKVFISYSNRDATLVKPFVELLRAASTEPVFWAPDSIPAGERWRGSIAQAIQEADRVFVFWCRHAAESEEVRKEYHAAIDAKKRVVPTLIDSTPLPADLSEFQWKDVRPIVGAIHDQPIQKNALLRDPGIHKRMARAFLRFLAEDRGEEPWALRLVSPGPAASSALAKRTSRPRRR